MDHATQVELIERVLRHHNQGTTDMEAPSQQPVESYLSPEWYASELEMIRRRPLCVGHRSQLIDAGSFITLEAAGRPLLLVRQEDGGLRAFLNVCRHRGARVEGAERGERKCFRCPYHAWTYRRDGELSGVPHKKGFPQVSSSSHSLKEVPVHEQAGLIYVGGKAEQLPSARFASELEGLGLQDGIVYDERSSRFDFNWKIGLDIFLEAYHVRIAHAQTIAPMFLDNIYLVDPDKPHLRNIFPKKTIASLQDDPKDQWRLREHANVLYVLFPNTLVLVQPDHSSVLHVFPEGLDKARVDSYLVVPGPLTPKAERYWLANADVLYSATTEDFAIGEAIQAGLATGANEALTFGRYEHALTLFHRFVRDEVQQPKR